MTKSKGSGGKGRRLCLREDDGGFSTLGMAVALGLSLVLVFSGLRVYRIQTESAGIQDVADVAALAAENQVATFVSVARICDAAVLSFSLAGITTAALGVAALCTPATAPCAEGLLQAAENIFRVRDDFSQAAAEGLRVYQDCLPFLATVRACTVARANGSPGGASYVAVAVLAPLQGAEIGADRLGGGENSAEEAVNDARESADEVRKSAEECERISKEAEELKRQAWLLDCGGEDRTLRERAGHLSGISAKENPLYSSVDAWSFAVPLMRCRAYYAYRLKEENPDDYRGNPEMVADSVLRKRIYTYAVEEFAKAYVRETDDGFDYYYPLLPRNMAELRETPLFTERIYPLCYLADGTMRMHASTDCPGAAGCYARGSISQYLAAERSVCPYCKFTPYSLPDVCAATSVINSGFEYYYRQIAKLLEQYKDLRDQADEAAAPAKRTVKRIFDWLGKSLAGLSAVRLEVDPPGGKGVIVIVANVTDARVAGEVSAGFLGGRTELGTCVAVSAATIIEDDRQESATVITGLPAMLGLEGFSPGAGLGASSKVLQVFLGLWNGLLEVYSKGQSALEGSVEEALNSWSWTSSGGLGTWAVKKLRGLVKAAGLEAAPCSFVRPVLVNTSLVAAADGSGFGAGLLSVKSVADTTARGGEWLSDLAGLVGGAGSALGSSGDATGGASGVSDGGAGQVAGEGLVITVSRKLLDDEGPLTLVLTLLEGSGEEGGTAREALGWILAAIGRMWATKEGMKDWR